MFWWKIKETCFNQPYAFPHSPYTSAFKVYFCCHENRACLFVIIILLCSKFQKEPTGALPTLNSLSPLLHSLAGSLERGEEWEKNAPYAQLWLRSDAYTQYQPLRSPGPAHQTSGITLALPQLHATTRFSFAQHYHPRPQNFGERWSGLNHSDVMKEGREEVDNPF